MVEHQDQPVVEIAARKAQLFVSLLKQRVEASVQVHGFAAVHRFDHQHQRHIALAVAGVDGFNAVLAALRGETLGRGDDGPDHHRRLRARQVVHRGHGPPHEAVELQESEQVLAAEQAREQAADVFVGAVQRGQRGGLAGGIGHRCLDGVLNGGGCGLGDRGRGRRFRGGGGRGRSDRGGRCLHGFEALPAEVARHGERDQGSDE
ncbi:hypothetical protein D9M68_735840 [compost metagenome]